MDMENEVADKISLVAREIKKGGKNIVFTGAGISTESGIPDFRSKGGIWDQYRPIYFDEFMSSKEARIEYWKRKRPKQSPNGHFDAFRADTEDLVPPIAHAGEGYRVHYTGLTHDQRGYPDMSSDTHHDLVTRLIDKVQRNAQQFIRLEEYHLDGACIAVIAYGCTARSARSAVRRHPRAGCRPSRRGPRPDR